MSTGISYPASTKTYSSSAHNLRASLAPGETYIEPKVLMTGAVLVYSGRQPWVLSNRPAVPPLVTVPLPNAITLAETVAHQIRSVKSAEAVYVKVRQWGFEYWIVVNGSNEDERFRLYDIEWELMEQNPTVGSKFHVVDRQNQPLTDVLTLETVDGAAQVQKV